MDESSPGVAGALQTADPRPQPAPDCVATEYGTLGPNSDFAGAAQGANAPRPLKRSGSASVVAIATGVLLAVLAVNASNARAAWEHVTSLFSFGKTSAASSDRDFRQLDRMKPQKQALLLLEMAVGNSENARDQIFARSDRWRGKLKWDPQFAALSRAALNSRDLRVREAGIEAELAAYGLAKNPSAIEYLAQEAQSPDHAQRIWGLWALGLMANRGIETERVVEILSSHLKDPDADSRRWAVEGLALVGTTSTIAPLLQTMHDDASPTVRERAACSLAESGMLTREQRLTAVPQLVNYTADPALDAQTHGWAFQALGDITQQRLPNDSAAWRTWYQNSR
jgi:hypothetical protein